jgi:hypothetical protein
MQRFPPVLTCFMLALLPTILASPTQRRQAASSNEYYLQTCVISATDDHGTDKEGLYVAGYHTGAGLDDVALTSDVSVASKGFLNATYQQFDYNTPFPWYLDLGYEPYAGACWIDLHSSLHLRDDILTAAGRLGTCGNQCRYRSYTRLHNQRDNAGGSGGPRFWRMAR